MPPAPDVNVRRYRLAPLPAGYSDVARTARYGFTLAGYVTTAASSPGRFTHSSNSGPTYCDRGSAGSPNKPTRFVWIIGQSVVVKATGTVASSIHSADAGQAWVSRDCPEHIANSVLRSDLSTPQTEITLDLTAAYTLRSWQMNMSAPAEFIYVNATSCWRHSPNGSKLHPPTAKVDQ